MNSPGDIRENHASELANVASSAKRDLVRLCCDSIFLAQNKTVIEVERDEMSNKELCLITCKSLTLEKCI